MEGRIWKRGLDWLLDLFFPPKCAFCTRLLEEDEQYGICSDCAAGLPWRLEPEPDEPPEGTGGAVSVFDYRDEVRESIHRYKFGGRRNYAAVYGPLVAQEVDRTLVGRFDLISWPPVSRRRKRKRGYDQAELLARSVARTLEVPVESTLVKRRNNRAQSGLSGAAARRENVKNVYAIRDPERVRGRRVLLVDDVITTGSTLAECAGVLRAAGCQDVVCASLARAGRGVKTDTFP